MRVLLYASVVLATVLLFVVQPLVAGYLLPWFGGASSTWSACLLFFQALVLVGYGYAHALARVAAPAVQRRVHLALLVAAVAVLAWGATHWPGPILPGPAWRPSGDQQPVLAVLVILAVAVGVPGVALAATSPLTQLWLVQRERTARWTRLYALSNLASIGGVLLYPLVLRPHFDQETLAWLWAAAFVVTAGCLAAVAALTGGRAGSGDATPEPAGAAATAASGTVRWRWLLLPAGSSVILLAATNQMCQEVAAVPLLWVLPLTLYLLSWVVTFEWEGAYQPDLFLAALAMVVVATSVVLADPTGTSAVAQVVIYSALVLVASTICHGELVAVRPAAADLTAFYLTSACGSVVGALFVSFVAPLAFDGFWELHVGLWLAGALALTGHHRWLWRQRPGVAWAVVSSTCAVIAGLAVPSLPPAWQVAVGDHLAAVAALVLAVIAVPAIALAPGTTSGGGWSRRAAVAALLAALATTLVASVRASDEGEVHRSRSFYGVLRVVDDMAESPADHCRVLLHGATIHGQQLMAAAGRRRPLAYYGPGSGVALAMASLERRGVPLRVGVVGMGVGAMAAYGRVGDSVRFYELDPAVVELARGRDALFTLLDDSPAVVDVVVGDGRLSLARELAATGSNRFDLLVIDAFSSDAVPVHLFTVEAFELYSRHLATNGLLLFHLTNRHLDLRGVALAAAARLGLAAVVIESAPADELLLPSKWVLVASDRALLAGDPLIAGASLATAVPGQQPWTDSYSDLVGALLARRRAGAS